MQIKFINHHDTFGFPQDICTQMGIQGGGLLGKITHDGKHGTLAIAEIHEGLLIPIGKAQDHLPKIGIKIQIFDARDDLD